MRLHRLRLDAVGPFASEQVVDFDRLSAGGLFLFEGPTGVGKSTVLDALTFALYGGLASHTGDPARLRSHFAAPLHRPEVQLEFSVRGQRHRVTRSPEYRRPKRRGTGETTEKSTVHLERMGADGRWESRSHAKDEVGTVISELIGLTRQQFRQVVLLPQGEFATFLRADDDERRAVLGRLFGTQLYSGITSQLQARAAQGLRARQAAESSFQRRVAAALEAAGAEPSDPATHETPGPQPVEKLAEIQAMLGRRELAAGMVADAAEADHAVALAARAETAAIVERVARRNELTTALEAARSQGARRAAERERLARARRAAPLAGLLAVVDDSHARVAELREGVRTAGGEAVAPEHLDGEGADDLVDAAAATRTSVGELDHLVDVEDQLVEAKARAADRLREVEDLRAQLSAVQRRAEALPGELAVAEDEAQSAQTLVAQAGVTHALLASERERADAAQSIVALERRVLELREARRVARRELDAADDTHSLLSDRRLSDLQGELAARLVAGDPCAVCGSLEHPAPARRGDVAVTPADVAQSAADRDHARVRLDDAVAVLLTAEADLRQARALAGGRTPAQWRERIAELEATATASAGAAESLAQLQGKVRDLSEERQGLSARSTALAVELARAEMQASSDERDLAAMAQDVDRARAGHPTVRARLEHLTASALRLEELSRTTRDLREALGESQRAVQRAEAGAAAAGFADGADARSALLQPRELEQIQATVEQWEHDLAQTTAALAAPELTAVAGVSARAAADSLASASQVVDRDERRVSEALGERAVARRQRERFADRLVEVQESLVAVDRAVAEHEQLCELDLYARGMAGSPRMTLVTFVLRYWFEEVVAAANARLEEMSTGKYQLLRVDEAARRGSRVGLGLSVLDRHTGQERSPATLSGGETFYTSLALALGLADVVVAQAGGAQLDTLFIDEGFGSLDPATLDDVMGVIDDLRGTGRVVGIVSHVPELKDRIAQRLSIRRERPDGPSQLAVVA